MNESHINRINELLGESVIYESKKKKTKIKLSLDDGSKKEMDFDGSLNDAKKKYSGKKVKTIRKSKSGDIIGEAVIVNVEELNEAANSGKKLIKITYEIWDEDSLEAGETDDKGWEDEEGEEFESDEDGTAAEKAIKFLKKKFATQASSNSYDSRVWYKDDGDTDMKTGDKKYLAYHLYGSWTPEEKKEIYKGITNKKINEAEENEENLVFEKPLDIFNWIKKEHQYLYVKQNKEGKFEGKTSVKSKKGWILVDAQTANRAVQIYNKVTDENKAKLDKVSLEKFLSVVWKLSEGKVNESEESDPVKKFPGQLKSILNTIKNSGSGKGPIEWAFPKVSYFHKGVIDAFVKYFQGKGYKVETGTSHPDRLYFNREIAQKLIKNEKLNESEETKESFKVNKELIVSESLPQYFETMLWSSTDMDSGEPLDKEYDVKDISKELKDSSKKDLLSFAEYCEKNCSKELEEYLEEEGYESFGHDFWLSRNGHGAGFFDRGNGYKALQKASKTLGSVDPMVNKGKIVV